MAKIYHRLAGLRSRRTARGLSVAAAAAAVGVTRVSWWTWEADVMPSASYLPAIADVLGCAIEELYEEPAQPAGEETDHEDTAGD